jgi:putative ABC transport system permease protein
LLAAIGIYGLLAYTVAQRTREIGVRMALGADVKSVGQMVLKDVARLVGVGVLVGLPLAFGMGRLVDSMLYGVKTFAFLTVAGALLVIVVVALGAALLPVRRAASVDPLVALRYE